MKLFGCEVEEIPNEREQEMSMVLDTLDMLCSCGLVVYEYTGFSVNDKKKPLIIGRYIVDISMSVRENGDYDGVEGIKAVYKII